MHAGSLCDVILDGNLTDRVSGSASASEGIGSAEGAWKPIAALHLGRVETRLAVAKTRESEALDVLAIPQKSSTIGGLRRADRPLGQENLYQSEVRPKAIAGPELDAEGGEARVSVEPVKAYLHPDVARCRRRTVEDRFWDAIGVGD